jgi:hypothetical protein
MKKTAVGSAQADRGEVAEAAGDRGGEGIWAKYIRDP